MIAERIEKIRKAEKLSRRKLEEKTGIADYTWQAISTGKQIPNEEHIKAISNLWPQYKYWMVFGETMPEIGQISPELDEIKENTKQVG
ncbi:MAG: helix-turn-helix transcriptional regulator [Methyloprofundus sp.]|nr:helix-turn-helix transcriptional regulator [Methyloprofundus sp.]